MTPFSATLRCASGCGPAHAFDTRVTRCPECGDLPEVKPTSTRSPRSAAEWVQLFESRHRRGPWRGSGVWGRRNGSPRIRDDTSYRGRRRLVAPAGGAVRVDIGLDHLWVKQSGTSHTGSFKDLGMTVLVSAVSR
jgi:threonine synthase